MERKSAVSRAAGECEAARVTVHEFLTQAELEDSDLVEFWDSDPEELSSPEVKNIGGSKSSRAPTCGPGLEQRQGENRLAADPAERQPTDHGGGVWAFCFPGEMQHAMHDHRVRRQEAPAMPPDGRQKMRRLNGKQTPVGKRPLEADESRSPAKARRPG